MTSDFCLPASDFLKSVWIDQLKFRILVQIFKNHIIKKNYFGTSPCWLNLQITFVSLKYLIIKIGNQRKCEWQQGFFTGEVCPVWFFFFGIIHPYWQVNGGSSRVGHARSNYIHLHAVLGKKLKILSNDRLAYSLWEIPYPQLQIE